MTKAQRLNTNLARTRRSRLAGACTRLLLIAAGVLAMPANASDIAETRAPIADKVAPCTACHGERGSTQADGYYPTIAGKPAAYLYNQLVNFQSGYRNHPAMNHFVAWLPDAFMREMATYFAQQPLAVDDAPATTSPNAQAGRDLVLQGDTARSLPACTSCHGSRLTGMLPATPGLIGLPPDYISAQLAAWRNGQRRAAAPDCMAQISEPLSGSEIGQIAAWIAAQPKPADMQPAAAQADLPMPCGSHASVAP